MALMRLELPERAVLEDVRPMLPSNWRDDMGTTQALGAEWARSGRCLGLWVPSFVESGERDLIINPRHAQYSMITLHIERNPFEFDPRLFE